MMIVRAGERRVVYMLHSCHIVEFVHIALYSIKAIQCMESHDFDIAERESTNAR